MPGVEPGARAEAAAAGDAGHDARQEGGRTTASPTRLTPVLDDDAGGQRSGKMRLVVPSASWVPSRPGDVRGLSLERSWSRWMTSFVETGNDDASPLADQSLGIQYHFSELRDLLDDRWKPFPV